jgi:O-antigen/teichoic acid export membrane protein
MVVNATICFLPVSRTFVRFKKWNGRTDGRVMSEATGRKTAWALCDQGVISAGNFVTNLLLIRHLPAAEFGVFALLLNAMLFLNNLHAATVTYTVCIRGAQAEENTLRKVASGGMMATLAITLVNVIALFFASSYVGHRELLVFVIAASLCWQVQECLRTVFVSQQRFDRALGGDAISYLGQALLIGGLIFIGHVTLVEVFLIITVTSLVAALVQGAQVRPAAISWEWLTTFGRDIWTLGRWSVLAKLVAFFGMQAIPWVLAYRHGLRAVAGFQALFQLVALTNPILLSTNNLMTASIAKGRQEKTRFLQAAKKYMLYSGLIVGVYFAVLLVGGPRVMGIFYGRHSTYLGETSILPIFILAYALEFVSMYAGAILAGMEETRSVFLQQIWGMVVSIVLILPLVYRYGLRVAVEGLVLINGIRAVAGWYMVYSGVRSRKRSNSNAVLLVQR